MTRKIEEIVTLGYEEKEKREEEEREEEEKKKRRKEKKKLYKLRNFQRKRKSMVIINLYKAKLMNEENWVEIETTEMRKNVKM